MAIFLLAVIVCALALTPEQMDKALSNFLTSKSLMGLSVQITKESNTIYHGNFGYRDITRRLPVQNQTCFRMASLSKNVAATGLYQLIEQKKLSLNDSLSKVLGFNVTNPYYPDKIITVQMLLTHQSTIVDCDKVYEIFLNNTNSSKNANNLPHIEDLFTPGTKYYDNCTFLQKVPGTYYTYTNLGYILVGNIIETITDTRFDQWMSKNYLKNIGNPSYNPATLPDLDDLAVLYAGFKGAWIPTMDDYKGQYEEMNLTDYVPGTNAGVFGPHAFLRATTSQMLKHVNLIREQTKGGLLQTSFQDMIRPRYQYHGQDFGKYEDWHAYGLGLYTTSYYPNDRVLTNRKTVGHTGSGYGLISGMYYTGSYAFVYVINGILNGYTYNANETIYQLQRRDLHKFIESFINTNS